VALHNLLSFNHSFVRSFIFIRFHSLPRSIPPKQQVFNRICYDQGSRRVDWDRPYITQVARFDPSKGIPDVLLAYQKLHNKFIDAFLPPPASDVRSSSCVWCLESGVWWRMLCPCLRHAGAT
jgi:glycosyltransferase involved in cell wall biosynthesis